MDTVFMLSFLFLIVGMIGTTVLLEEFKKAYHDYGSLESYDDDTEQYLLKKGQSTFGLLALFVFILIVGITLFLFFVSSLGRA